MTTLPDPEFKADHVQSADTGKHSITVTASRPGDSPGKERSWKGEGYSVGEAVGKVFKEAFGDHRSTELIRKK